jgi:hypothetical protein
MSSPVTLSTNWYSLQVEELRSLPTWILNVVKPPNEESPPEPDHFSRGFYANFLHDWPLLHDAEENLLRPAPFMPRLKRSLTTNHGVISLRTLAAAAPHLRSRLHPSLSALGP